MNKFWLILEANGLSDNPGKNWSFALLKNSFKNKQLKFCIVSPSVCSSANVELKTSSPGLESELYEVTPLNPLIQPVKEDIVFPVYVITSSPIFRSP